MLVSAWASGRQGDWMHCTEKKHMTGVVTADPFLPGLGLVVNRALWPILSADELVRIVDVWDPGQ